MPSSVSSKLILDRIPIVSIPLLFDENDKFYSYKKISLFKAIEEVSISGSIAQFGVYKGRLARYILDIVSDAQKLYLFDSFEGLPEDWVGEWKKGTFKLNESERPIFTDPRVTVVKGWFSEKVPGYFDKEAILSLVHIDCDLYSSTLDVLENIDKNIVPGTIVLFDEYTMVSNGIEADDEHRALIEWGLRYKRKYRYLWRTEWKQVAIRVEK